MIAVERFEKRFLIVAASVLAIFFLALGYSVLAMGVSMPGHGAEIQCRVDEKLRKVLRKTPPFDSPGVHQTAPGKYNVVVIGQTWLFTPGDIELPAGAEVTFYATSADVIHGFEIAGTRVTSATSRLSSTTSTVPCACSPLDAAPSPASADVALALRGK